MTRNNQLPLLVMIILGVIRNGLLTPDPEPSAKHQDNPWLLLCDMHHPNQFIIDASVPPSGCVLTCVVLTSSSEENKDFFDANVHHVHNLTDGISCKQDHVCQKGECLLELENSDGEKRGIVVVDILDAYVPKKDTMTQSDTYVRVEIKNMDRRQSMSETKVVWDTEMPVFNQTFKEEKVPITSTIFFELFDKDMMGPNDYIGTVYAPIKNILRDGMNHKKIKLNFKYDNKSDYYLNVKISWMAYD